MGSRTILRVEAVVLPPAVGTDLAVVTDTAALSVKVPVSDSAALTTQTSSLGAAGGFGTQAFGTSPFGG